MALFMARIQMPSGREIRPTDDSGSDFRFRAGPRDHEEAVMSTPMPRLLSLVTAVPDQVLRQSDVKRAAREMFCPDVDYFDRLQSVFDNRRLCTKLRQIGRD